MEKKHPLKENYDRMFRKNTLTESPTDWGNKNRLSENEEGIFSDPNYKSRIPQIAKVLDGYLRDSNEPQLIIDGSRGVYIPKAFVDHFFKDLTLDPDDENYWEDWEQIMSDINDAMHNGYLQEDGDLFVYPNDYEGDGDY